MATLRAPRTTVFEYWKGKDKLFYCHLKSGREIIYSSEGYKRIRSVKRVYEIMTSRTKENTHFVFLESGLD